MTTEKPSLAICTPIYDSATPAYVQTTFEVQKALTARGIESRLELLVHVPLPFARNALVRRFLATDCTHLLWLDADVGVAPANVVDMLDVNVDVIGMAAPHGGGYDFAKIANMSRKPGVVDANVGAAGLSYCFKPLGSPTELREAVSQARDGFIEVRRIGTGCMLIRRSIFERLSQAGHAPLMKWPMAPGADPITLPQYFQWGDDANGGVVGEDYYFCDRVRDIGGKIHMWLRGAICHEVRQAMWGSVAGRLGVEVPR